MSRAFHVSRCVAVRLMLTALLLSPSLAQEVFTYKTETHLIATTISVRDAQGGLIDRLTRDDFTVVEDGVPQTIRFFARERDEPLDVGLIIDVSGSQEKFVKQHERDIEKFLREVMEPKDEAFVVCFGNHLRLVSDFSGSGEALTTALKSFDKGSRDFDELGPKEDRELGTALYDAIYFSIEKKLKARPQRRKVLLVMSDGEENSSEHDLLDAIGIAQNANVLVYAIRYTDAKKNHYSARDRYGIRVLDHLAAQTGGRAFDVKETKVEAAFAEVAGEVRSLYDVAYQATNRTRDGTFRKVVIACTQPGVVVRSRVGYYAR